MKTILLPLVTALLGSLTAQAKVTPLAHYNFGRAGNVTYAVAPETIQARNDTSALKAVGKPLFYADAPAARVLQGEGGILFSEKDGYLMEKAVSAPADNQILEIWVKVTELPVDDTARPVIVNGGEKGYAFLLKKGEWFFTSAGSATPAGKAEKGQWIHLAAALDNGQGIVYRNGEKQGSFSPAPDFSPQFSLASSSADRGGFHGMIYEARVSTFGKGEFVPADDLLFNEKTQREEDRTRLTERKALIRELEKEGPGKEIVKDFPDREQDRDWLISRIKEPCKLLVKKSGDGLTTRLQLNNGLVSRSFYVSGNIACTSYKNLTNGSEYLRAVKPEARLKIDGKWYEVGGLKKQPEYSYLLDSWLPSMEADKQSFRLTGMETGAPLKRYEWKRKYNAAAADWPAKGLRVTMTYRPTEDMTAVRDLEVKVSYEIYQGIPVIAKWVEVTSRSDKEMILNETECEVLAVNQDQRDRIHVESDFSFAHVNGNVKGSALIHFQGMPKPYQAGESTTLWSVDPEYNTWASHNQAEDSLLGFQHRNLLTSRLPLGPDTAVSRTRPFKSFVTFELLQDNDDRERKSLAHRRLYRALAPQVTESLLAGGITSDNPEQLRTFIDQMAELGMERLDIMAWVGIQHDNLAPKYTSFWKDIAAYARERSIVMGGYELQVASRGRGEKVDCINPETGKSGSLFGQSVCVASEWQDAYFPKMWKFFDETGLMTFNMDGPYHGDVCASTVHPHHRGMNDSQWEQWSAYVGVLHELQRRGMYVPIPDWYFLNGQSVTGMGYREASANLTPQQQLLLGRQYIYDGTWHKLPTMGWMTLQLVGFYTNDPRVGLEPLNQNLDRYEQQLVQYLASGCQLTIRGNRLYDTPETKAMLKKWIDWYKAHREILSSEIIHVSRPTGRDLDCMLHANPFIEEKGMLVVFNPTDRKIEKTLKLPLYYTGLNGKATVMDAQGKRHTVKMNDRHEVTLPVTLPPQSTAWFVIKK